MKEKISFLAYCDYANVLTEYSKMINDYSEKYESKVICLMPHPFNYLLKHDYDLNDKKSLTPAKEWIDSSNYIIFSEEMGSGNYDTLTNLKNNLNFNVDNKKLSVWHPGSNYRKNYNKFNSNPLNNNLHNIIYAIDLFRLSNKKSNEKTLLPFMNFNIDSDLYMDNMIDKINKNNRIFLHCPSNTQRKGSDVIKETIDEINREDIIYHMYTGKPHNFIMEQKKNSLFYIDQFNKESSFGVASIEALICGNITMCGIENAKDGIERYGSKTNCPIINLGNDKHNLKKTLSEVMDYDKNKLITIAENNLKYLLECYNGKSVINYIENKILGNE
jgi:hypothetical protein